MQGDVSPDLGQGTAPTGTPSYFRVCSDASPRRSGITENKASCVTTRTRALGAEIMEVYWEGIFSGTVPCA
jgi:hypothetical protein